MSFAVPQTGSIITVTTRYKSNVIGRPEFDETIYEKVLVIKPFGWTKPNEFCIPAENEPFIKVRTITLNMVSDLVVHEQPRHLARRLPVHREVEAHHLVAKGHVGDALEAPVRHPHLRLGREAAIAASLAGILSVSFIPASPFKNTRTQEAVSNPLSPTSEIRRCREKGLLSPFYLTLLSPFYRHPFIHRYVHAALKDSTVILSARCKARHRSYSIC